MNQSKRMLLGLDRCRSLCIRTQCSRFFSSEEPLQGPVGGGRKGRRKIAPKVEIQSLPKEEAWSWGWSPPLNAAIATVADGPTASSSGRSREYEIPVIIGANLTLQEVTLALDALGGIDIVAVPIPLGLIDSVTHMVFCTGQSPAHIRRLSGVVVKALKQRNLEEAPGFTGAEGEDCDDWMLVDCGNLFVHLLDAHTRRSLKLEEHWRNPQRHFPVGGTEEQMEARIDLFVANNPVPADYNVGNGHMSRSHTRLQKDADAKKTDSGFARRKSTR